MSRVIEVDVEGLWHNTFVSSDKGSLGPLHLATAHMLLENPETPVAELPLYKYMASPEYRALPRASRWLENRVAYLEKYRQVFKSIKARGYFQQPRPDPTNPTSRLGLIPVKVKPDGTVCLKDGARRLTTILVLGRQKRIKVEIVEENLQDVEKLLLKLGGGKKNTYQPLGDPSSTLYHPHFRGWGVGRPDTPARFRAILSKLGGAKTILEIGPCEGYFSINLAAKGHDVTAVERHPDRAKILRFFANLRGLHFPVVVEDWRSYCARTDREFDAALLLSTFHHQVIQNGLGEFKKLGLLGAKRLFLEMATNKDPRMGKFPTLNGRGIVQKVLENTGFTHQEEILASQSAWRTGIFTFW